jgi:hypothetical protein
LKGAPVSEWAALSGIDVLDAELSHLNEVWLEKKAAGHDLAVVENAIKEAQQQRRRYARRLERLAKKSAGK